MEVINRCAMVITPKVSYLEWANRVATSYETLEEMQRSTKVLLLPSAVHEDSEAFLLAHAEELFALELEAWTSDQRLWPQVRTAEVLQQWFEITLHVLVIDFSDDELGKEPYR